MAFKYDITSVKEFINKTGYTLLSSEFINSQEPLKILCSNGHIIKPCFSEFKRKARCNDCSGNKKPTIASIQEFIKSKGFTLISTEYVNNNSKLSVECSNKHIWSIHWNNLKNGNGCPDCYGNKKFTLEEVTSHLNENGYSLVDKKYKNMDEKMTLICPNNHLYTTRFHDFKNGKHRCSHCSFQTSNAEKEILNFIKTYYPNSKKVKFYELVENCPKEYKNKELDIYIPELRVAIEYCGLYWHSAASGEKPSNKHRSKLDWCRLNNIRLITLFEDEWLTRKDQVKNLLYSIMLVHATKIGARKCTVIEIDKTVAKTFIDENHIQSINSGYETAFGIFNKGDLLGVITGSNHHRQNNSAFVLQRLCFKSNTQIQGGASKLFKYLKTWASLKGYSEIISWSDNRISEGNVYKKLNFTLRKEYLHDYSYVLEGYYSKRYSKQSLKKTKEERLSDKTEWELRKEQDYYRIFDCGKKSWVYKLN